MSRQNLTIEEAAELFNQAGVPRSPRTISRYCEQGVLESIVIDTEKNKKYLITQASVERRIKEIKQVLEANRQDASPVTSGHNKTSHDTTRHDQTRRDMSGHDEDDDFDLPPKRSVEVELKKMKAENFQLQIDRAAKEQVIERLMGEREHITRQVIELSRENGRLENQLLQPEAPARPDMSRHDEPQPRDTIAAIHIAEDKTEGNTDSQKTPEKTEHFQKPNLAA